jgi:hypothetical protein
VACCGVLDKKSSTIWSPWIEVAAPTTRAKVEFWSSTTSTCPCIHKISRSLLAAHVKTYASTSTLPRLLTSTSLNKKLVEDGSRDINNLSDPTPTSRLHQQLSRLHHQPPRLCQRSSANQAKSLISITIFSSACFPHIGTNAEDYFVYASQRLLASRGTPHQLFFGDVDRLS